MEQLVENNEIIKTYRGNKLTFEEACRFTDSKIIKTKNRGYYYEVQIKSKRRYYPYFYNLSYHPFSFIFNDLLDYDTVLSISKILRKVLIRDIELDCENYIFHLYHYGDDNYYTRIFFMYNGLPLYLNKGITDRIDDPEKYMGYDLISTNPLSYYIGIKLNTNIKDINGITVISNIIKDNLDKNEYFEMIENIRAWNMDLRESGKTFINENIELVKEICDSFNMEYNDFEDGIIIFSNRMIGCQLVSWLEETIDNILMNEPVLVRINGKWQIDRNIDRYILKYLSLLAFNSIHQNELYDLIDYITINSDLSISVPVYSNEEYITFTKFINYYFHLYNKYHINIETYNTLLEARSRVEILSLKYNPSLMILENKVLYFPYDIKFDIKDITKINISIDGKITTDNINIYVIYQNIKYRLGSSYDIGNIDVNLIQSRWNKGEFLSRWGIKLLLNYKVSIKLVKEPEIFYPMKISQLYITN